MQELFLCSRIMFSNDHRNQTKIPNQPQLKGTDHNRFMGTFMSFLTIYGHTIMSIWLKTILTFNFGVWVVRGLQLRQHLALQASQVCPNFSLHTYPRASQSCFACMHSNFVDVLRSIAASKFLWKTRPWFYCWVLSKSFCACPVTLSLWKDVAWQCVLHKERGCKTESEQSAMW